MTDLLAGSPRVIAVGGLVATGKSTVARALAARLDAPHVEADRVHDDLLSAPGGEPVHEAHWWRSFEAGFEARVYRELMRRAEAALAAGRGVVLDGCFARAHQRLEARALARAHGLDFVFVECRVPPEAMRLRLAERDARSESGGWGAISDDLAERWEPVTELPPDERVVLRSDGPVEAVLAPLLSSAAGAREAPTVVTFDCWNTLLVESRWAVAHALRVGELRDAAREAGREVSADEAGRAFDAAWRRHMELWVEGQSTGAEEVARWGLAELGLHDPHPALEHLVRSFQEASHSSGVVALDGARETLAALERAGVACALVCDTGLTPGRVVRRHLDRERLLGALAVQAFSDEVGAPKPDARVFHAALEPLGGDPARAVHVGDLRRTDVAGARALGMASVRIHQAHDDGTDLPEADHVVASHAELRALLAELGMIDPALV
ncbi:MAG TPA: AAA family ATPase [Myxococcota bacterium]|nr:AAA family ATPase [Myxococcota bacterium]